MTKRQKYVCSPDIFVFWSLYCLSSCYFCLVVIVLSVLLLFLSFGHCIVCPPVIFVFWSLYCLPCYFCLLVIVLSVLLIFLSFGHCIVCSPDIFFFWSLYCLPCYFVFWSLYCLSSCYFCLLVKKYQENKQYNDQKTKIWGGQTIQWPQDKNIRRTDNTMTKRQK
jgi:hypothetical protein